MAILRCKMCGGDISISENQNIGTCEYCGCSITIPRFESETMLEQFNTGNDYRMSGDFDKAISIFGDILAKDDKNAEAHWCNALAKYGIEYVEDPVTFDRIPTCHRLCKESILEDIDFKKAIEQSDGVTKRIYEREARKINEIMKDIIMVSENEEPYDIFISFKELDQFGTRTEDSVIAQDLYEKLTSLNYRVFFSRISLEDKVGEKYEPYIFSALHSSKVMLLVGTKPEYLQEPWVKNEWSRFLAISNSDNAKKLIPCYKNMSPTALPNELGMLQAQDLGKLGAMQDLVHGLEKIFGKDKNIAVSGASANREDARLERAFQYIEDEDFYKAEDILNNILEENISCAKAFIGLLLCELELSDEEELLNCEEYFGLNKNFQRALKVATPEYKEKLQKYDATVKEHYMESSGLAEDYDYSVKEFYEPDEYTTYDNLADDFQKIIDEVGSWKEAESLLEACKKKVAEKEKAYSDQMSAAIRANKYARKLVKYKNKIIVGLRDNGTVVLAGDNSLEEITDKWRDIVKVDITDKEDMVIALSSEGEFLCTDEHLLEQMENSQYKDLCAGDNCIIGLKKDGTVLGVIDGKTFNPTEWKNIEKVSCSGKLIAALDKNGKILSNSKKMNDILEYQISSFKDVLCKDDDIYTISKDGFACAIGRRDDFSQFENIKEIKVVNGKLYGLSEEGVLISEKPTGLGVRRITSFSDVGGPKNEYYYDWSKELVDFGVCGDVLYGIRYDGKIVNSKKEITKVNGTNYFSFIEEKNENVDNAVAMFTVSGNRVVVLSNGSLITFGKYYEISDWKLFDSTETTEQDLASKRSEAIEIGNTMFFDSPEVKKQREMLADIEAFLEQAIEKVTEMNANPSSMMGNDLPDIGEMRNMCTQVQPMLVELKKDLREPIEQKILILLQAIDTLEKSKSQKDVAKYCTQCGNPIRPGKKFCSQCGNRVG